LQSLGSKGLSSPKKVKIMTTKLSLLTQVLPVEIVTAMLNSGATALTDQEVLDLADYSQMINSMGYYAVPFMPEKVSKFYISNDLNNMGGECYKVQFTKM